MLGAAVTGSKSSNTSKLQKSDTETGVMNQAGAGGNLTARSVSNSKSMLKDSSEKQQNLIQTTDRDNSTGNIKRRVGRPRKVSNLKTELESKIKVFDAKRSKSKNLSS